MYSINSLKKMEVVDVKIGCKLGFIKDLEIECNSYKIVSIVVPSEKVSFFSKNNDIKIPWRNIIRVGVDVILVNVDELFNS
jgi:YlmC/YmxH family sporulation protein